MKPSLTVGAPLRSRLATGSLWICDEQALRPKTEPRPSRSAGTIRPSLTVGAPLGLRLATGPLWICDEQALGPINRAATVRERRND